MVLVRVPPERTLVAAACPVVRVPSKPPETLAPLTMREETRTTGTGTAEAPATGVGEAVRTPGVATGTGTAEARATGNG